MTCRDGQATARANAWTTPRSRSQVARMRVKRPVLTLCGWLLAGVMTGCSASSPSPSGVGARPGRPTPLDDPTEGAREASASIKGEGAGEWEILFPGDG